MPKLRRSPQPKTTAEHAQGARDAYLHYALRSDGLVNLATARHWRKHDSTAFSDALTYFSEPANRSELSESYVGLLPPYRKDSKWNQYFGPIETAVRALVQRVSELDAENAPSLKTSAGQDMRTAHLLKNPPRDPLCLVILRQLAKAVDDARTSIPAEYLTPTAVNVPERDYPLSVLGLAALAPDFDEARARDPFTAITYAERVIDKSADVKPEPGRDLTRLVDAYKAVQSEQAIVSTGRDLLGTAIYASGLAQLATKPLLSTGAIEGHVYLMAVSGAATALEAGFGLVRYTLFAGALPSEIATASDVIYPCLLAATALVSKHSGTVLKKDNQNRAIRDHASRLRDTYGVELDTFAKSAELTVGRQCQVDESLIAQDPALPAAQRAAARVAKWGPAGEYDLAEYGKVALAELKARAADPTISDRELAQSLEISQLAETAGLKRPIPRHDTPALPDAHTPMRALLAPPGLA